MATLPERLLDRVQDKIVFGGLSGVVGVWVVYEGWASVVGYSNAGTLTALTCLGTPLALGAGGAYLLKNGMALPGRPLDRLLSYLEESNHDDNSGNPGRPGDNGRFPLPPGGPVRGGTGAQPLREPLTGQVQAEGYPSPAGSITDPLRTLTNQETLHVLLVGYSGGGKTTLAHAMAMEWVRNGLTVVAGDPDAAPGLWRGCFVVGAGDNFEEINYKIKQIAAEVKRRRQARAKGHRNFEPLYVILDEYQDIHAYCPDARPFVEDLLRRGRKLGIHLVLGVQDRLVKTVGFEGQGELRRNFTWVVDVNLDQVTGERFLVFEQNNDRKSAVTVVTPRLPDLDRLITPIDSDGRLSRSLGERLGLSPNGIQQRLINESESVTTPAPVLVLDPPVNGHAHTSKNGQNGQERPSKNGVTFGQERPLVTKPPMSVVTAYIERQYDTHLDFSDPPDSFSKDRAVFTAVGLSQGMSQNAILRGVWGQQQGKEGGRYRDYIQLVQAHLDRLNRAWTLRLQRRGVK